MFESKFMQLFSLFLKLYELIMKIIVSAFVSLLYSLNLLVNEIEVPFTNSILVKNGTRRVILLLFTLVNGFELASLRYRFMNFSDRTD